MNPLDILRRTPKNNCGACGYPTCLAFSAAVVTNQVPPAGCPYIDLTGLTLQQTKAQKTSVSPAQEKDLALIEHLKSKIAGLDFSAISGKLGAVYEKQNGGILLFNYLGQQVYMTEEKIMIQDEEPEDPRDHILLYNYVASSAGRQPLGNWIGLESLPNSISKVRTLAVYCEERLAELFSQQSLEKIKSTGALLNCIIETDHTATLGLKIPVLPMVPQFLLYWQAEPEDGFGAKVKVLFDEHVMAYLDLESLVFSAERMADRFNSLLKKTS